jgi:hypothetical protein
MAWSGNNAERHVDAAGRWCAAPCHRVIFATSSAAHLAGNNCLLRWAVRVTLLMDTVMPPTGG